MMIKLRLWLLCVHFDGSDWIPADILLGPTYFGVSLFDGFYECELNNSAIFAEFN